MPLNRTLRICLLILSGFFVTKPSSIAFGQSILRDLSFQFKLGISLRNNFEVLKADGARRYFLKPKATISNDDHQDFIYPALANKYVSLFRKAIHLMERQDFISAYVRQNLIPSMQEHDPAFFGGFFDELSFVNKLVHQRYSLHQLMEQETSYKKTIINDELLSLFQEKYDHVRFTLSRVLDSFIQQGYFKQVERGIIQNGLELQEKFSEEFVYKNLELIAQGSMSKYELSQLSHIISTTLISFHEFEKASRLDEYVLAKLGAEVPCVCLPYGQSMIKLLDHHRIHAARSLDLPIEVVILEGDHSFN